GSIDHEIFPDGCISLVYHRNEKFNLRRLFFNGLNLESITAPVFPTDIYWGMRISPAACARVLRTDPANFRTIRMAEAEKFPHLTDGLREKLNACENFDCAVAVFENHLRQLNFGQNFCDEKIAQAIRRIEETSGEIKIAELAAQINLSSRQLERRFKKSSGLSPKQFARTRRIRATAVDLVENNNTNWANRAAEMGFADQSHLTHEFVAVTKRSPNSFAEKVSRIKHGNLVK
ncbi:MAG TPA: AraC family transcriptional regulator, partial [Pyrinomonadaceae bacterium]|nr:AraC family transcriptional regulator [Pyrinomonadaceae bacterium]